jgi:[ribosomal protein S5]-alanine N-acetyltransferase
MRLHLGEIYLRPLVPDDAEAQLGLLERNREFFRPYEPLRPAEQWSVEAQRQLLFESSERADRGDEFNFGVFKSEGDLLIGRVNLSNIVRRAFQNAYIGYYLDRAHNGRGFMTNAVDAAVDFGLGGGRLHRIQAAVMPENHASIRVVEKVGFRHEGFAPHYLRIDGEWRDHNLYAITAEDRLPPRRFS